MIAEQCECCGEDNPPVFFVEPGGSRILCRPCRDGAIVAIRNLRKAGIEGMFRGPCPDNSPPPKP